MSNNLFHLHNHLKEAGLSDTKPRRIIFNILEANKPLTMKQLTEKVTGEIDRASVYRIITLFEKLDIVRRINIGWKYKLELSDQFMPHHHHLSCLKCGRITDIKDEEQIDEFISLITDKTGFKPSRHQFEIEGYCHNCQKV